ncbi:Transcriptional regulatory protein ZraR [Anatilimnocola aggregata]|uniref:Transcriptional regulatory protein ZraR n=1 Tax=Anatilimnocola aggregata TaxID=2528021 RepID=A0A517YJ21_9BACT|nr:helix-turn-helix domain-containing protein [Anatilimnocola aggregata]QDU30204.1 Transcriptional regulatory protein ZraR [Anatilimnocola aggregata]
MPRPASPARLLLKYLDRATNPVYLVDGERRLQFANEACCQWLGRTADELQGLVCNYLATSPRENQPPAELSLGPPPEAFKVPALSGEVFGGTASGEGQIRSAVFHSMAETSGSEHPSAAVLVIVGDVVSAAQVSNDLQASPTARLSHLQLLQLRRELDPELFLSPLIGQSHALKRLREQVKVAQQANVRVLMVGPKGSGRRQLARAIHYVGDASKIGPLASVDCPVMDAELMQLTLTRFLKQREGQQYRRPPALLLTDVDQLRADAQQELAGFLLLPGVELQTISTATRSLHKLAARGKFRLDLAFALSTFTLTVPALAKRLDDVPLLAQHFLEQYNSRGETQHSGFANDAIELLTLFGWPGNVEELAETVREACERAVAPLITAADLPERLHHGRESLLHQPVAEPNIKLDDFLAEVEKELLQRALKKSSGNKTKAAELLGVHRARLIRRLVQLGLIQPTARDEELVIFEPIQPDPAP